MQFDQRNTVYLGHLGAIPLFAHWSVLILLYTGYRWGVPNAYNPYTGALDYSVIVMAIMLLLGGIVLHELGHGIAARMLGAFGVKITLWAMGGLCSSTRDSLPRREIIILAAGPAVSFALAAIGYYGFEWLAESHSHLIYKVIGPDQDNVQLTLLGRGLHICFIMNLVLGIFNMLPIYPLDGGQIVFNVLLTFLKHRLACQISFMLACLFAAGFLFWSFQASQQLDFYSLILMGYLLFNAYNYLR